MDEEAGDGELPIALDRALDAILSPLAIVDRDLRLVAVNLAYCEVGGRTRDQLLGVRLMDAFPENPDDEGDTGPADLRDSLTRVLDSGRAEVMPLERYDVQEYVDGPFVQRYWSITTSPIRRSTSGPVEFAFVHAEEVTTFIDDRLRREAAGDSPTTAGQTDAIETVFTPMLRRSEALNAFAEALVRSATVDEVASAFLGPGIELVNGSGGAFVQRTGDRLSMVDRRGPSATSDRWTTFALSPGAEPFSDAIINGEPLMFASREEFSRAYPSLHDAMGETTNQAWAVLPLSDGSNEVAAIGVTFARTDLLSSLARLDLQNLAALTAQAMSRAILLAEQTEAIGSITRVLEADLDAPEGVSVAVLYRPAANLSNAGGDWFDVIATTPTRTVLAIGDVAAHGAGTYGEMLRARSALQSQALRDDRCSHIASVVSTSMARFSTTFATACIAVYDAEDQSLRWTTAGHPYPLLVGSDGAVELLRGTHGPPLGVLEGADLYGEDHRYVEPGSTLVLYTDGLIERHDENIDASLDRLLSAARAAPDHTRLAAHLYSTLLEDGAHSDDVAILVARFADNSAGIEVSH